MDILSHDDGLIWKGWKEAWPLSYPKWFVYFGWHPNELARSRYKPLYNRAQERANRRLHKKAMKAARAQGLGKRSRMPGAWPV